MAAADTTIQRSTPAASHKPVLMLVLATSFWGMGFSWAKNLGNAINHAAGRPADAPLGPLLGLTLRFSVAAMIWTLAVPAARRGWTWWTVRRGGAVGVTLSAGLILQHLGLGRTDEATTAFLTNLTVVFVPAWGLAVTRRPPPATLAVAVLVALSGLVLLSGVGRGGDAVGAAFGVGCAAAFAAEILLLDRLSRGESAARITLALFIVSAAVSAATTAVVPGLADVHWRSLLVRQPMTDAALLTGLTTLAAFALMTAYQPRVDPGRAAVVYLFEPLFAAAFAWAYNGRALSPVALGGAGLILLANVIAEWKWPLPGSQWRPPGSPIE